MQIHVAKNNVEIRTFLEHSCLFSTEGDFGILSNWKEEDVLFYYFWD